MKRFTTVRTIFALVCISALTWMIAQPQSAAAMPLAQDSATATIQGTVLKPDGSPAIGADIKIGIGNHNNPTEPRSISVDPETATFEISVEPGTWRLAYGLLAEETNDEYAGFRRYGNRVLVSAADNQTVSQDLTLIAFNATVRGSVLIPDGMVISEGSVRVTETNVGFPRSVPIVDGQFETQILANTEYTIEVDEESGYLAANDMGQVSPYKITVSPNSVNEIALQTVAIDAIITGTVYEQVPTHGDSTSDEYELVPVPNTDVSVWLSDDKIVFNEGGPISLGTPEFIVQTDENGVYMVPVSSGTTWIVGAWLFAIEGPPVYFGWPQEVTVADSQTYEIDLKVNTVCSSPPCEPSNAADVSADASGFGDNAVDAEQLNQSVFLPVFTIQ